MMILLGKAFNLGVICYLLGSVEWFYHKRKPLWINMEYQKQVPICVVRGGVTVNNGLVDTQKYFSVVVALTVYYHIMYIALLMYVYRNYHWDILSLVSGLMTN